MLVSGRYALATGKDLRQLDFRLLIDISYAIQYEQVTTLDKERADMIGKLDSQYDGIVYEYETGLPAISRFMPPADEMEMEGGVFGLPPT